MRGAGIEPAGSCTLSGQPGKQKRTYLLIVRPPELPRLAAQVTLFVHQIYTLVARQRDLLISVVQRFAFV